MYIMTILPATDRMVTKYAYHFKTVKAPDKKGY